MLKLLLLTAALGVGANGPIKQWLYSPFDLGIDAITLDAVSTTSTSFSTRGWNQLTIQCNLTWIAATDIRIVLEHSADWAGSDALASWAQHRASQTTVSGASPDEVASEQLFPHTVIEEVSATGNFEYSLGINHIRTRLIVTDTGGGVTDILSCHVTLGAL